MKMIDLFLPLVLSSHAQSRLNSLDDVNGLLSAPAIRPVLTKTKTKFVRSHGLTCLISAADCSGKHALKLALATLMGFGNRHH